MNRSIILIGLCLVLFVSTSIVLAQEEECPALVREALNITRTGCEGTKRNEICYGHLVLQAKPQPGFDDFAFENPGDIVDVSQIESLSLSALDTLTGVWGIVLMQLQANLPQTALEDVTFLLFGDVALDSAIEFAPIKAKEDLNIRSAPTTNSAVVGTLKSGEMLVANARLADSSWLRVRVPAGGNGWVSAPLVTVEGDIADLNPVSPEADDIVEGLVFGPMQAFYFRSGKNDSPCAAAPESGMLIQTPEGVASVTLYIDEVVIQMNATAFVQAEPSGELTVSVLDGAAVVEAEGESHTAIAGTSVSVPLDEDLAASAPPDPPEPLDTSAMQALPIELLSRPVDIPEPVTLRAGEPIAGNWLFSWGVESLTCPDGTEVPFATFDTPNTIRIEGGALLWNADAYNRTGDGVYSRSYADANGNLHQNILTVVAPDQIQGQAIIDFSMMVCTLTVPFQLQLVGPAGA